MEATCEYCGETLSENLLCREEFKGKLDGIIHEYKDVPGALIPVLHKAQELLGYLPEEVQIRVADGLGVPLSEVSGVISFYTLFTTQPRGKYKISICKGTACYVRGSAQVIERLEKELGVKAGETTEDAKFSLEVVRCLGACGLGPVMTINEDVHARLKMDKVPDLLDKYR